MKEVLISAQNITKQYGKNIILNDINIDIYKNDFTVIMGSSGAGKSTLLYALSGMDQVSQGRIFYKGNDICQYKEKQMAILRNQDFGFVFQQSHLVSHLSLLENTTVAGFLNPQLTNQDVIQRAHELFVQMNIDKVKHHLPSQVSGGEAQRAAIVRAVINQPEIIFCDEPTGALNKTNSEHVLDLLSSLNQQGQSILMVTHDMKAALRGHRLIYLEDGQIVGEKRLDKYTPELAKEREQDIQNWLSSMEW